MLPSRSRGRGGPASGVVAAIMQQVRPRLRCRLGDYGAGGDEPCVLLAPLRAGGSAFTALRVEGLLGMEAVLFLMLEFRNRGRWAGAEPRRSEHAIAPEVESIEGSTPSSPHATPPKKLLVSLERGPPLLKITPHAEPALSTSYDDQYQPLSMPLPKQPCVGGSHGNRDRHRLEQPGEP